MFVDATQHTTQQYTHKPATISLFSTWMQAWNIYLTTILTYNPTRALELVGYQHIITSADHSLPLKAWLQYDRQFCTLAASNPSLRWDQCHSELWYEAMAAAYNTNQGKKRWPYPYLGLRTTTLRTAFTRLFVTAHNTLNHLTSEYPELQCAVSLTMDVAQEMHVLSNTFACHARAPSSNLVSRQNRQKTSQPEPVILDPCHNDHSLSSVTKYIIELYFHPSILCSQPVHHYFQYSTFKLAPLALSSSSNVQPVH